MNLTSFLKSYRKNELIEAEVGRPKKKVDDAGNALEKSKQLGEIQNITKRLFTVGGPLHGILNYKMEDNVLANSNASNEKDFIKDKYGVKDDEGASLQMMAKGELSPAGKFLSVQELFTKLNMAIQKLNLGLSQNPTPSLTKVKSKDEMIDEFFDKVNQNFNAITLMYKTHIEAKKHSGQKKEVAISSDMIVNKKNADGVDIDSIFDSKNAPHEFRAEVKKNIEAILKASKNPTEEIKNYLKTKLEDNDVGEVSKYGISPRKKLTEPDEEAKIEFPNLRRIQKVHPDEDYRTIAGKKFRNSSKELEPEVIKQTLDDEKEKPEELKAKKERYKILKALLSAYEKRSEPVAPDSKDRYEEIRKEQKEKKEEVKKIDTSNRISLTTRQEIIKQLMGLGVNVDFSGITKENGVITVHDKTGKKFSGTIVTDENGGSVKVSR